LNLHVDKILFDLLGNVINDEDDVAIPQPFFVEVQFELGVNLVSFGLGVNPQLLNLINNTEVRGQIDTMIVRCGARVSVNLAGKLFQMNFDYGEAENLKVRGRL
jgi:hypothetical protein